MIEAIIFLICLGAILFILFGNKKMKVDEAKEIHFKDEWEQILQDNIAVYEKFSDELKQKLKTHILLFLNRVEFEGVREQQIDDEVKLTIAAQACLLIVNQEQYIYHKLKKVVVYPRAYKVPEKESAIILGQSCSSGVVYLSWDATEHGAVNWQDGRNVAIHEFAHQLDQEDGLADGVPLVTLTSCSSSFAEMIADEYLETLERSTKRKRHVIDDYAKTNPAEFFSVATESFFEKPSQMKKKHTELYEALKDYYKVDPIEWV